MTEELSNQELLQAIRALVGERIVAFNPAFARLAGSAAAGILLSQFFYWSHHTKHEGGWFWKTGQEIHEETGLSRSEQETSRRSLVRLGILEESRRGVPARMWFRVDLSKLVALLAKNPSLEAPHSSLPESSKLDCDNPANKSATSSQTIHKITTENTDTRLLSSKISNNSTVTQKQEPDSSKPIRSTSTLTPIGSVLEQPKRGRPRKASNTPQLDAVIEDISERLGEARLRYSNTTRARNLMVRYGLSEPDFCELCHQCYATTKDRQGTAHKPVPYFFECLNERLERHQEVNKPRSLAGKYAHLIQH